jgi:hypothetical protein
MYPEPGERKIQWVGCPLEAPGISLPSTGNRNQLRIESGPDKLVEQNQCGKVGTLHGPFCFFNAGLSDADIDITSRTSHFSKKKKDIHVTNLFKKNSNFIMYEYYIIVKSYVC